MNKPISLFLGLISREMYFGVGHIHGIKSDSILITFFVFQGQQLFFIFSTDMSSKKKINPSRPNSDEVKKLS